MAGRSHYFEELLDDYECSWQQGAPLEISTLVKKWENTCDEERRSSGKLLAELVMIALEYSWRQNKSESNQCSAYGSLKQFDHAIFDQLHNSGMIHHVLIEEFRSRHRWGDRPSLEQFENSYPGHFAEIRDELLRLKEEYAVENSIRQLFDADQEMESIDTDLSPPKMSISDFLSSVYPFSELPSDLKDELAATAEEKNFAPGDYLMTQGAKSDALMVVMEGIAKVTIHPDYEQHDEQELARVGVYSLLGEIGLLTGEVRSANIIAMTSMRVAEIRYEAYQSLVSRFPTLNMLVSELIAQRVGTIATDIMFGKTLGGYQFRHRLGRGSMGIVYLAEDLQSARPVAVKMLRHDLVYDRQASQRFRREAEMIRRLKHQNIIDVYREFSAYNTFFLSMEYCRGCTLADAIQAHSPFPQSDVRKIIGQLAAALHHAHSQGVIHRDLKPANVMLTAEGVLKLTDFGLARSVECLKMTAHGQMLGTPRYMPSELLGGGEADERADLYALGAIAWELITGEPLFNSGDIVSLLREQLQWQMPRRDEVRSELSEDLYRLLQESLSQNPEERILELEPLIEWAAPINESYCVQTDETTGESSEAMDSTLRVKNRTSENINDASSTS